MSKLSTFPDCQIIRVLAPTASLHELGVRVPVDPALLFAGPRAAWGALQSFDSAPARNRRDRPIGCDIRDGDDIEARAMLAERGR
jgi:hypothetical protein